VQDTHSEWESEAANIADIYSGSWVMIAAAQAENSSAGFLSNREIARHAPLLFHEGVTRPPTLVPSDDNSFPVCTRKYLDHSASSHR
jgi:hypothetical protein